MPWNNTSGGSNSGGPWGGGGGRGGSGGGGPWGSGGGGGGGGGRNQRPPQDLEKMLREGQERMRSAFGGGGGSGSGGGFRIAWPVLLLLGVAFYAYLCFYTVNDTQRAIITRFGAAQDQEILPGGHFRIWPIDRVNRVEVTTVRATTIGEGPRQAPRRGSVTRSQGMMLAGDKNLLDIKFTVQWRVKSAKDFLFNLRDPEAAVQTAAESAMREVVGREEAEYVRGVGRSSVRDEVETLTQQMLDDYGAGVEIRQVLLNEVDPPQQVNEAFREVEQAQQEKERLRNQAQLESNRISAAARGQRESILAEAAQYATETVADAQGEAAKLNAIYNQYRVSPEIVRERLYLETMERVMRGAPKIILDSESGALPYLPLDQLNGSGRSGGR